MLDGPYVTDDGQFAYAAVGNVLLTSQQGALTVDGLEAAARLHRKVLARHPGGTCLYAQVSELKMPDAEIRTKVAEGIREFEGTTICRAIVLGDDGFVASIVRSVFGGISLLGRARVPERYFATNLEAAAFLAVHAKPTSLDEKSLAGFMDEVILAAG